jgi:oligopeptide/dipeptide ABC transporter ATP-binding protein
VLDIRKSDGAIDGGPPALERGGAMTALLEPRNVTKVFGEGLLNKARTVALEDFSFQVDGETPSVTAIVGESGSGKTTLVRLLLGLTSPTEGEVRFHGKPLTKLSKQEKRLFLREVQAIFQDPFEVYNPFYKVDHVLQMPIENFGLAKNKAQRRSMMEEALSAVGLRPDETLGRYPHQLSGGQRQRIMVARALILRPKVIIADEPVSMVDASLRATILNSLLTLNRDFGISLIYITHDLTTAYQISHDVIVLYQGSVAEAGNAELVVPQPKHPYTKLLVGSIPVPDPDEPWLGEHVLGSPVRGLAPAGDSYCRFYLRCPSAMEQCVKEKPPLYVTDPDRVAACYLYQNSSEVVTGLGEVLGKQQEPQSATAAD